VAEAVKAHEELLHENIKATVINARFVKPLDCELILSYAGKITKIITVEDHVKQGGFGSAVLECIADSGITGISVCRLGIDDTFVEHGTQNELRKKYGIDVASIVNAARSLVHNHG